MSQIDTLVQNFLAQKSIAVVGVSTKRDTGCNLNYDKFKAAGYTVYAVSPNMTEFQGDPCYPDLKSIPQKPDAVFIFASPKVTDQVVLQAVEVGVKHIWMHCMMGTKAGLAAEMTSVSQEAVQLCRENGIEVIPGSCPAQFLNPDFGHKLMRGLWRLVGNLKIEQPA
ncbi:MAG: CoA-binding protein [Anaerolineae bacterium]|nr:CoA-binding protein [Anaerolineae bacterium]